MTTARIELDRGPGLALGIVGLGLFAVLCGVGVAIGELQALVVAVSLVAAFATFVDYRVGAVLLMVMLPVESSYLFPRSIFGITGFNPLNLLLLTTLVSYLARGRNLKRFLPRPLAWLYIAPILVAGLIGARHVDDIFPLFYEVEVIHFTDAFGYLRDLAVKPLLMVLAALLIGQAVAQSQKAERFLVPIIVSVWLMSLMAIVFAATSGMSLGALASAGRRGFFSGLGLHANDLGRLYAVAYALLLFTWWETKDLRLKTTLFFTMGVLAIALILTFSRGAFVGFALVNALFLLWKFNARTLGLGVLAVGAAPLLLPGAVWSRLMMGFGPGGDANAVSAGRVEEIWAPLLPELLASPPWGNGLDSVMWSTAMWAEAMLPVTHPHNAYLQVILDMGLIGLALLVAYYLHVYRNFRALGSNPYLTPTLRGFYQGAVAGLACFAVTGFAGSSLRPVPEFAFLWIAIGMMYGQLSRKPEPQAIPREAR